MSSDPQTGRHWPFNQGEDTSGAHGLDDTSTARERSRFMQAYRGHARHDRLIVGGRAHMRKRGLS
jgi:hypothetical protein